MAKVAVFASGTGSNFQAIDRYLKLTSTSGHQLCCLVSDKPACGAVSYARANGIPVILMAYAKGKPREQTEAELVRELQPLHPALLVLAGFMRLLTPVVLDAWPNAIINIHPSLLPRFPGAHGIADSYASPDRQLGITIHYVDSGLDSGEIILQQSFERTGSESLEEIEKHLHELEHSTYPVLVNALLDRVDVPV